MVFIDEAQNLSLPLLEEIRILSDSDGRERQLQVVLVGQLELRDKLRLPEMRQVSQRVLVRCSRTRSIATALRATSRTGCTWQAAHPTGCDSRAKRSMPCTTRRAACHG